MWFFSTIFKLLSVLLFQNQYKMYTKENLTDNLK